MKLSIDKKYMKISFHVIFTVIMIYAISLVIKNLPEAALLASGFVSKCISVLSPLIIALVFSYIADPAVDFFQNKTARFFKRNTVNRRRGVILTYLAIAALLAVIIRYLAVKIGGTDINSLAKGITESIQGFSDLVVLLYVRLDELGILQSMDGASAQGFITSITTAVTDYIMGLAGSFTNAGSFIINMFIGLTAAFYLLAAKERILYFCGDILDVFLSEGHSRAIKGALSDINTTFSNYIGGQITDAIIMAVLISLSFSVAGIRYPVIIGIISGFSNLIPYVGAIVAFVLSVGVGLLSGTPIKALYAAIIVLALQQLDSIFIVPKVVGKSVELHPVLVLLSLSIFGSVFGISGMIVAVPVTALAKLYLSRWYQSRKQRRQAE